MLDLFIDILQLLLSVAIFCVSIAYMRLAEVRNYKCRQSASLGISLPWYFGLAVVDVCSLMYTWKARKVRERQRRWLRQLARITRRRADTGAEEPGDFVPPRRPYRHNKAGELWCRGMCLFMCFWTAPVMTAVYCQNRRQARCLRQPHVLMLELIIIVMMWAHLINSLAVRPAIKHYIKRWRPTVVPRLPVACAPSTSGYPFVQRVCYVSSLSKYSAKDLPHPPVELAADSAMCSVCFDDFDGPESLVKRRLFRKQGPFTAPTLWKTRCGHVFHEKCLLEWFKSSRGSRCPYCNQDAATVTASSSLLAA